jgi:hypothetical protein
MNKKRQLVPNKDFPSISINPLEKNSFQKNPTTGPAVKVSSRPSQQTLPLNIVNHNELSATSLFLQHLKQTTLASTIEIVSDNPVSFPGVQHGKAKTGLQRTKYHRASPTQQRENGHPHRIVMTPDQKKIVRWDTHSTAYRVAAVTAATAALAVSKDTSASYDSVAPASRMPLPIAPVPIVAAVHQGNAAAPTCPRRRQSKENCLQLDEDDDLGKANVNNKTVLHHPCVTASTSISQELTKLREKIEWEEERLKRVVQETSPKQTREQRLSGLGGIKCVQQSSPILQGLKKVERSPRARQRKKAMMSATETTPQHYRSCNELSSATKFVLAKGGLPDYEMALNEVAQRYATRPGRLSSYRSSSTGMLPTSARTSCLDVPLGIPLRRISDDTLAALDQASALAEVAPLAT